MNMPPHRRYGASSSISMLETILETDAQQEEQDRESLDCPTLQNSHSSNSSVVSTRAASPYNLVSRPRPRPRRSAISALRPGEPTYTSIVSNSKKDESRHGLGYDRERSRFAPSPLTFPPTPKKEPTSKIFPLNQHVPWAPPTRFWLPGQKTRWHKPPLGKLMTPGQYRAWERTKTGPRCQTYMMYLMAFKRNVKGLVPAPYRRLEDGSEVPVEYWGMVVDHGHVEEDGGVGIITGSKADHEAADARAVQGSTKVASPTQNGHAETPGSERMITIRGGSYSLTKDVNSKKRDHSDSSGDERANRSKRRLVGGDEEGDGGESENGVEKENDAKKDDSGDEMKGLEQTE